MTHLSAVPRKIASRAAAAAVAAVLALAALPAAADPHDRRGHGKGWGSDRGERWHGWKERHYRRPVVRGHVVYVPAKRTRHYRNVVVVRPYGHWYPGFAHYRRDRDAYRWLALTAITVRLIDHMSEHQQRTYEAAQVRASAAPVGEVIAWNSGAAHGTVVAVREGTSSLGRYCREFQQTVNIGGRTEEAYGTACRQPDGAWEVVSAGQ